MKRISILLAAIVYGMHVGTASAAVLSGPTVNPSNGETYYLLSSNTWTASESEAVTMGGNLATINSLAEDNWVLTTFGSLVNSDLWIGLYDPITNDSPGAQHAADFIWASGQPVTYTNWGSGEPNDDPGWGGEYYGSIAHSNYGSILTGQWNDESNAGSGRTAFGVVEVPEPNTIALVGAGAIAALLRVRRRVQASSNSAY
jgi:hypothetical protein